MLAIYNKENTFSENWERYCTAKNLDYIKVNVFDSNIVQTLKDNNVTILLAHISHVDHRTNLIARSIFFSIEKLGIKVFPNYNALWHFDDKISQKYIFEVLEIPHARMKIFYTEKEAVNWLSTAEFPLIFKLRGGAGSSNVFLLKNRKSALRLIKKMFSTGIRPIRSVLDDFGNKISIHSKKKDILGTILRLHKTLIHIRDLKKKMPVQNGYFLAQEFLPGNEFDTRIVIVGNKAFAFRRFNRQNDFRASGSKNFDLNQDKIDKRAIVLAFESAKKIGSYSMAFDIIFNTDNIPVIIEMSYICPGETINQIGGYWNPSLVYHNCPINIEDAIIEHVLESKF